MQIDVHVVLVSLLADQLSGQFLIFFGRPKKKLSTLRDWTIFLSTILISFVQSQIRGWPIFKKYWTKKFKRVDKKNCPTSETRHFLGADQKNKKNDRTVGRPKRLTKTTWTSLILLLDGLCWLYWLCYLPNYSKNHGGILISCTFLQFLHQMFSNVGNTFCGISSL